MGFSQARTLDDGRVVGGYARIWKVEDKGKYCDVQLSTSKKNKDGGYDTDFQNNFVRFVGRAYEMAKGITDACNIQIKSCEVTRFWSKQKEKEYINFTVFDFDFTDGNSGGSRPAPAKAKTPTGNEPFMSTPDDADEEMPF